MSESSFSSPDEEHGASETNPYATPHAVDPLQDNVYVTECDELLNPWFSIWSRPRATIRQIVETDPTNMVLLLAAISGVGEVLDKSCTRNLGDQLSTPVILVIAALFGPLSGVLGLYVEAALLRIAGGWLGGVANSIQLRAALAWSAIPHICAMGLWLPELALFGREMFTSETPRIDGNLALWAVVSIFGLVEAVVTIWQMVVMLKCIGEVHQFSAWKALGSGILAGLMIFLPLLMLLFLLWHTGGGVP